MATSGAALRERRVECAVGGAGVTNEPATRAFGLRFLALEDHVVELWAAERWHEHPGVSAIAELLNSSTRSPACATHPRQLKERQT